jgi:hypothetical protein
MVDGTEEETGQDIPEIRKTAETARKTAFALDFEDPILLAQRVNLLCWSWSADFHLYVTLPSFAIINPPKVILPAQISGSDELEFVYPIHDYGYKISTSKGEDMFDSGMSMCKLYFTIEKMVTLLLDKLKSGGTTAEQEVQVAFGGHILAQRKAFESIINLTYNVVVTNFDPGVWGEHYLQNVKVMSDKGYGYPAESPRDVYKQSYSQAAPRLQK